MSSNVQSDCPTVTDSECESIASKESTETSNFNELNYFRHQNKRLREELNIYKQKVKTLETDNQQLRISKCAMQAKVEVEEEFITNSLLRQISSLKKNMENVKSKFEREEECVVTDLTNKLNKLENDKARLERLLETSRQENYEKLNKRIKKLEDETRCKQKHLDQLRTDKGDIQNALEQEQEALLHRLWRNIYQAENERLMISDRIDVHCNNPTPPKLYASLKTNPSKKTFSLQPQELRRMSMDELTKYVLSLQRELTSIQNRSSTLDPEKYQKLLVECDIKDEKHWIKQKIPTDSEWNNSSSRSSSDNLKEHSDNFKTPGGKGSTNSSLL